jgi:hypothetical protein
MSRADWPLDIALQQLRELRLPYKWDQHDLRVWWSICPACRAPEWGMRLREGHRGGPVTICCSSGCSDDLIRHALTADPNALHTADALELAERARDVAAHALELAANAHSVPELREQAV